MNYVQGSAAAGRGGRGAPEWAPRRQAPAPAGAGAAGAAAVVQWAKAAGGLNVHGLPLLKPPYGRITAIDLNKGDIVWQVAHGETPDNIKNNPGAQGSEHSAHRTPRHSSAC